MAEHFDVIVVGAGISGIGAARHLRTQCPNKTFAILEARAAIGGTWDLFRYPGIRSDSDMYTLGYGWKPWLEEKGIADGASILSYVRETARENEVEDKIRLEHRVTRASWSTERGQWTVDVERGPEREAAQLTCKFLYMCPGYYRYDQGYTPDFPGASSFTGKIVHPQLWNDEIDYAGKRVVVIGSGATAVTLVPALAEKAAHVTMLQRSPTYVVSGPAIDPVAKALQSVFAPKLAYAITRWKNILLGLLFYVLPRLLPGLARRAIVQGVRNALGPDYDVDKHFSPRYAVWDQRVCLVPDQDLFHAIREGRASVVTDQIETFTPNGIRLVSGEALDADLIVTATGLELRFLGGMALQVDGRAIELPKVMSYKGCMFSDVPNLAYSFGYTNASWTLKADLTSEYVCRLIRYMDAIGATRCTPRRIDRSVQERPFLDFTSGYVQRGLPTLPKQGSKRPYRLYQNYLLDLLLLRHGALDDGALEFAPARGRSRSEPAVARLPSSVG
jgi:cation diffusion facilitator CzcD-associated flavoprotein CzcO